MRLLSPLAILVAGVGLLVAGFVYDVLFANLPYQDPSPEQQAAWLRNKTIAGWVQAAGLLLVISGALSALVFHLSKRRTRNG